LENSSGFQSNSSLRAARAAMAGCTTLKDRRKEIGRGLLDAMLHDLDIDRRDL